LAILSIQKKLVKFVFNVDTFEIDICKRISVKQVMRISWKCQRVQFSMEHDCWLLTSRSWDGQGMNYRLHEWHSINAGCILAAPFLIEFQRILISLSRTLSGYSNTWLVEGQENICASGLRLPW